MPLTLKPATGSGQMTLISVAGTTTNDTLTFPAKTGNIITSADSGTVTPTMLTQPLTSATSIATTSGTSIDFTGIPSWVKRITVMISGVSTNGTSLVQIQVGAGSVTTSGYISGSNFAGGSASGSSYSSTTGFLIDSGSGSVANLRYGLMVLTLLGNNTWVENFNTTGNISGTYYLVGGGGVSPALSGALDRVRLTTVNGTDAFDAGSINILYE